MLTIRLSWICLSCCYLGSYRSLLGGKGSFCRLYQDYHVLNLYYYSSLKSLLNYIVDIDLLVAGLLWDGHIRVWIGTFVLMIHSLYNYMGVWIYMSPRSASRTLKYDPKGLGKSWVRRLFHAKCWPKMAIYLVGVNTLRTQVFLVHRHHI